MSSPNIAFDNIPASIRKPGKYFEFNTSLAVRTLPANRQRMLIIGQRLTTGSVAQLMATQVFSDTEAAACFGAGSIAHLMARAAMKANPYLDLSICALDDSAAAAVARVHTLALATNAGTSGYLTLYVGNVRYQVGIAAGDTPTDIGTALKAVLDNDPALSFSVTHTAGTLVFTAKNKGVVANQIDFECAITASGTTAVFTATTPGAVDPTLATALAAVYAEQYDIIACPFIDDTSYAALKTHLDTASGPMEQRPAVGVLAGDDALGTITTLTSTINSGRITFGYIRATRTPAYETAAIYAAVMASEEDPARPLNTLALPGVAAPVVSQRLSRTEQESCLANGATPFEVGPGEVVQIVRAVSTYVHNPQGIADISLLDITTIRTLDYVRKACRERIALRFPREKLSSRTPEKVRDQLLDVLYRLEELEIVEEVAAHEDALIVERDSQDPNRLNARIPADVVNGLHIFAGRIDLLL